MRTRLRAPTGCRMALLLSKTWERLVPLIQERCPRLTPADIEACEMRSDLLAAKVQNRHWCDRQTATRLVEGLIAGLAAAS